MATSFAFLTASIVLHFGAMWERKHSEHAAMLFLLVCSIISGLLSVLFALKV